MASSRPGWAACGAVHRTPKLLQSRNLPDSLPRRTINPSPPHPLSSFPYPLSFSPAIAATVPRAAMDTPPPDATKTVRVVIKGLVQGVFYRNWTVENAAQLGLKGWVRNRRDGSVEALFSGSSESVQEMEQRCRRGPTNAIVTGFQVFSSSDDPGSTFERRPTA